MKKAQEYRFRIDAYSPSTLPMARLAEYMADLAGLLGCPHSVHFVRLEEGSTVIVHDIEIEDVPKVQERLSAVRMQEGPPDAMRAFAALDRRLAQDNAVGMLSGTGEGELMRFPGRDRPRSLVYEPIRQQGSLDGILIRIGGRDDTVPVHLLNEEIVYNCNASRQLARQLAPYLFGPVLRVQGAGRWHRDEQGRWILDRFAIAGFQVLKESPLTGVVARLRSIEGSAWKAMDDPLEELRRLRQGSDEVC